MKIAVGSLGTHLDAWVGGLFGYCPQFLIVDSETQEYVVVPMAQRLSEREASRRGIRIVARQGAEAVLVEKAMPACREVMQTLGIEVIEGLQGLTVREAIDRYLEGRLSEPKGRRGTPPRIAVAAQEKDLDAPIGPASGPAEGFVIVDPATDEHHYLLVDPPAPGHRVCLETIRALVGERVGLVVLPHITPPCCQALWSLAIDVVLVPAEGTVREVIARYKSGQLGEAQVLWPKEEDSV